MLVRDLRRLCLIIGPFLAFFFITLTIWGFPSFAGEKVTSILGDTSRSDNNNNKVPYHGSSSSSKDGSTKSSPSAAANGRIAPGLFQSGKEGNDAKEGESTHQTIHSVSTKNGSYFRIEFAKDTAAFNPNIIPHPTRPGVFVVVAQKWHGPGNPSPSPPSPHSSSAETDKKTHTAGGSSGGKTPNSQPVTMQSELSCLATFNPKTAANVLSCLPEQPPLPLPIAATPGNNCVGPLGVLSFNVGPRDARVFYGGDGKPYTIFGSNSQFTCFGMWMQDFRVLVEWWGKEVGVFGSGDGWRVAGELQRPALPAVAGGSGEVGNGNGELKGKGEEENGHREGKNLKAEGDEEKPKIPAGWGEIEKNWFVFWAPPLSSPDSSSSRSSSSSSLSSPSSSHHQPQSSSAQLQTYIHYDFFPHRSFALLHSDGSATPVSSSMSPISAANDEKCLSHYLPPLSPSEPVSIHQSTNSLRLTLCNRSDPSCSPTESNTFLLTIIQHKRFYHFHSEYEPYVVLFSQKAPSFEVFGVSKKPVWIQGRKKWGKGEWHAEGQGQGQGGGEERTEMFYVTSVNWRDYHGEDSGGNGAGYHGYLDDVLIIGFGVEDKDSGGIDVLAGELVKGVGLCEEVVGKGDVKLGGDGGEKQVEAVGHGVSSPVNDASVPDLGLGPQEGENVSLSPPQEPQQPLDLTGAGSDGSPAQDVPLEIPADFPATFPKDFPAAADPALEPVPVPPAPPQPHSG